jgi:flagellar biosynthesis component FlhA
MWAVHKEVFESQAALYDESMEPFLNILDPSGLLEKSPIYREFEDYFYYAQLQIQGEGRQLTRLVSNKVPLEKIPSIIQAMGYYPSNQEIDDLINEVKCKSSLMVDSRYAEGKGEEVESMTFHDLIKLFINHRPYGDLNLEDIELSLSHAKRLEAGRPTPTGPVKKVNPTSIIKTEGIVTLLQQYGKIMFYIW